MGYQSNDTKASSAYLSGREDEKDVTKCQLENNDRIQTTSCLHNDSGTFVGTKSRAPTSLTPPMAILSNHSNVASLGPVMANNVINQQGIKNIVHDVQLKRQKEIRDMMKKKREKAVLVDRISRWLFPTSFILLNIVYWALFGDHDLW